MSSYTVDASVAIKWFVSEPLQGNAWTLGKHPENLIAPDLLLIETANVAWKKAVRGEIARAVALEIVRSVGRGVHKLFPAEAFASQALEIGFELNHAVYDCMYIAVAETTEFNLVTADTRLIRLVKGTRWQSRIVPLSSIPPLGAGP